MRSVVYCQHRKAIVDSVNFRRNLNLWQEIKRMRHLISAEQSLLHKYVNSNYEFVGSDGYCD